MNDRMWVNEATAANVEILRGRGIEVIEPATGALASRGESGTGRLPEPAELLERVESALAGDMAGLRVLVTAGGTREPIDPVRFIGNRSSGRMGFALAERARARGAEVTVVAANVGLSTPPGVSRVDVETTADLADACGDAFADCDVLLMAAAPADFRPAEAGSSKLERAGGELRITLVPTGDVLASLAGSRSAGQTLVGFAAEHGGDGEARARLKLERKGVDLVVMNDVSDPRIGFDSPRNAVTLVGSDRSDRIEIATKAEVAERILDRCLDLRSGTGTR
jgi:phosphopantothenoylcysteine decarboxylase/phosphopantothenate--cysteine ligase